MLLAAPMNLFDLTISQLKRATAIKEQIEDLNKELRSILGASAKSGTVLKNQRTMSASVKKKIAAAQKARWSNLRRANPATPVKRASKAKKKTMSRATKAKLSAKLKAYWSSKKNAGKK